MSNLSTHEAVLSAPESAVTRRRRLRAERKKQAEFKEITEQKEHSDSHGRNMTTGKSMHVPTFSFNLQ